MHKFTHSSQSLMSQKFMIVINQEKMLCIYYTHWWQSVTDGATVTEWVVNFKQKFCNALAVKHKYSNSLPINEACNYKKRRQQKLKVHTNTLRKSLSNQFSLKSPACYSSTQFIFVDFPPTKITPIIASSFHYKEELNCWFFASSKPIY